MAPGKLALRWRSEKRKALVSHVKPGEAVRVEALDPALEGQSVEVFQVPERALHRVLYKVLGRVGLPQVPLAFVETGPAGPLSEPWNAAQFPPPQKPTRYVAALASGGASGPLLVTDALSFEISKGFGGELGLDASALTALSGLPMPIQLNANGEVRIRSKGVAYGVVDPHVRLSWMTSGGGDRPIEEYLEPYLDGYAKALHVPREDLRKAFYEEYGDCFERPAIIGAEFWPNTFEIGDGDSVEVDVDIYPREAGRALAAVGLVDLADDTLMTVSDLAVLTYAEDGLLFWE
jgi:hypothetical protein